MQTVEHIYCPENNICLVYINQLQREKTMLHKVLKSGKNKYATKNDPCHR